MVLIRGQPEQFVSRKYLRAKAFFGIEALVSYFDVAQGHRYQPQC